jgi:hypothetical protein
MEQFAHLAPIAPSQLVVDPTRREVVRMGASREDKELGLAASACSQFSEYLHPVAIAFFLFLISDDLLDPQLT